MNTSSTIQHYLNDVTSNSPTPGGGNVSAFCGALAASLGIMVCNLTVGKKKYADVEKEVITLRDSLQELQTDLLKDAQLDNEAFDNVMAAFKLPKGTPEEQEKRKLQIEAATLEAAQVPFTVIEKCSTVLPLLCKIGKIGNQNSLSDAAVGCYLVTAAANGAYMNVLINCNSLPDSKDAALLLAAAEKNIALIQENTKVIVQSIMKKLKPLEL